ncbi:MAG: HNH endonuclease signature motif containing protein, partial [Nakamurella sp.]
LACDAGIIPTVLGADGAVLDCGTEKRLFTLAQKRVLWGRDRHCTFPGCDIPAQWTDAHHLVHWIDGGPTDIDNAALLCPSHHTIVHRDELHGEVAAGQVVWDRRPGTYRPTPRPAPDRTPIPPGLRLPRQRSARIPLRT